MTIYSFLEHHYTISWVLQAAVLAGAILMAAGLVVRRQLAVADRGLLPDEGVSVRNVLEVLVDWLADLARSVMGDEYRRYFPIVGTIFFFVLVSNLMGLVPGVGGSTSDTNVTTAWAILSFAVYNYVGVRTHRWKYIYQFMGPSLVEWKIGGRTFHVRLLAWFFLPLEILLHLVRILTLSLRLLANMFADHSIIAVWIVLVPVAIPAVFMGLGLLIAILQAFVFALLSMIYIGLALEEPH